MEQGLKGPQFGNQSRHVINTLPSFFLQGPHGACPSVNLFLLIPQTYFSAEFSCTCSRIAASAPKSTGCSNLVSKRDRLVSLLPVKNAPPPLCLLSIPDEFSSGGFFASGDRGRGGV